MTLVRDNATALYIQIAARLRSEIADGQFEPSGRMPAEAALGARFGVSRVTVRLALAELEQLGLIARRRGKGTFVAGRQVRHALDTLRSFHEALRAQGMDATMRILELASVPVPAGLRALFGPKATSCTLLRRLHLVDGKPVALGSSYLPGALAKLPVEEAALRPTYALLDAFAGRSVASARLSIGAARADRDCAGILKLRIGAPLLVLERTSHFAGGDCAEQSTFCIRPERYRFVLETAAGEALTKI